MKNKHNSIYLQELNIYDVTREYVNWLNDYSVVQFTEQKFYKHNIKSVKKFVQEKKNYHLFGVLEHKLQRSNGRTQRN